MKRHFEHLARKAARPVRHWWLLMITGILSVALGVTVFMFPLESYVTISVLFGVLMLVTGIIQLLVASLSGNYFVMRGYVLVGGVLDLILGLLLCFNPGVTLVLLPVMLGLWLLYHSFMIIAFAADMDTFRLAGRGWVIAGGIILALLSIIVLANPLGAGIAAVIAVSGCGLVIFGILTCMLSVRLRDIHLEFEA